MNENNDNSQLTGNTNFEYYIEDVKVDPKYGVIKMKHWELLDGNINGYIKSEHFKVTDKFGNEIHHVISTLKRI